MKFLINLVFLFFIFSGCIKSNLIETLEQKVQVFEYEDSNVFTNKLYCYYLYQGLIDTNLITPALFSKFVKGASLKNSFLPSYIDWLKNKDGKKCLNKLSTQKAEFNNLDILKYSVHLNLTAISEDGSSPKTIKNHELLHVAYSINKKNKNRIKTRWDQLSSNKKEQFKNSHPGYNFNKTSVLYKEFFSYSFEDNLVDGLKFIMNE